MGLQRQDSGRQREQAVMELSLALGGSVTDDRIQEELKNTNKVLENAYLALVAEEFDGGKDLQKPAESKAAPTISPKPEEPKTGTKGGTKGDAKGGTKGVTKGRSKAVT